MHLRERPIRALVARLAVASAIVMTNGGLAGAADENPAGSRGGEAPNPELWTMPPDGTLHEASGTKCLAEVKGFDRMEFSGAADPVLGTCIYIDDTGTGDAGVRVRRYLPGVGGSRTEIENDRTLMEPDPNIGAPLFTVRMGAATTRDGKMGGRLTITKVRNGYLVDCFAEGATLQVASAKMALICAN
jgi:hypothetical protein